MADLHGTVYNELRELGLFPDRNRQSLSDARAKARQIARKRLEAQEAALPTGRTKKPGFLLVEGRAPVAGKDFSERGDCSQDDYEYHTGTGAYSNDPAAVNWEELVVERGAIAYYSGGFKCGGV
jgi:hypothetical protein